MPQTVLRKTERGLSVLFLIVLMLIGAGLTVYAFLKEIRYVLYEEIDMQTVGNTRLIVVLPAFVLLLFILRVSVSFVKGKRGNTAVYALPFLVCAAVSLFLIFGVHGLATTDALKLDQAINRIMTGDYSDITAPGGYLHTNPQQIGYVAFGSLMVLCFGESNYIAYQLVNLLSILLTLLCLYGMTGELFPDDGTRLTGAFLTCGMLFLPVYSTFIYNDIPALAPQAGAMFFAIRYVKRSRVRDGVISALLLAPAVVLKTNTVISAIAIGMVLLLRFICGDTFPGGEKAKAAAPKPRQEESSGEEREPMREKPAGNGKRHLVSAAVLLLVVLCAVIPPRLLRAHYAHLSGLPALSKGEPMSAYFAMGLQENEYGQSGWYNGYNARVYHENGNDTAAADRAARQEIADRLRALAADPSHAFYFFAKKFLTQWGDASCISMRELELTSRHVEGHADVIVSVIYGKGRSLFYTVMKLYQLMCYCGFTVYCAVTVRRQWRERRGRPETEAAHNETPGDGSAEGGFPCGPDAGVFYGRAVLLLYIFGGMVFHLFFEASSRYTMRYYIFLLPFAAEGLRSLLWRSKLS